MDEPSDLVPPRPSPAVLDDGCAETSSGALPAVGEADDVSVWMLDGLVVADGDVV
jgi:hypothetical protein